MGNEAAKIRRESFSKENRPELFLVPPATGLNGGRKHYFQWGVGMSLVLILTGALWYWGQANAKRIEEQVALENQQLKLKLEELERQKLNTEPPIKKNLIQESESEVGAQIQDEVSAPIEGELKMDVAPAKEIPRPEEILERTLAQLNEVAAPALASEVALRNAEVKTSPVPAMNANTFSGEVHDVDSTNHDLAPMVRKISPTHVDSTSGVNPQGINPQNNQQNLTTAPAALFNLSRFTNCGSTNCLIPGVQPVSGLGKSW